ncbi:hypothetical protein [Nonlabens ulvanivorans]|uniref:hypothetical protein n=1 Tax=Nonlabens ulvanivorans TaxID=906888 RepID=UPI002942CD63|nr:hypothetical protein [Nonlabens ulvanivorans]WOI23410.1 hypothetical protein R1T42_02935 [Nonlabens ulvanivorans]
MKIFDKIFGRKNNPKDFPPKPSWKPDFPINYELILEKAIYYTDNKRQFAIFQFGTVVTFPDKVTDIEVVALKILEDIYLAHPDFNPKKMDDGNYVVEYSQPAFTIIFSEELERYSKYIEDNYMKGLCKDEVLINSRGQANVFETEGKIGLFGRSKMFLNAQNPEIVLTHDL